MRYAAVSYVKYFEGEVMVSVTAVNESYRGGKCKTCTRGDAGTV
jgi:hypothetical protein